MSITFKNVGAGTVIRAPNLNDFNFIVGIVPTASPLGGSSAGQTTINDSIYDITTGATVTNCPHASSYVIAGQSSNARYTSLTPSVCTVNNLTGATTYVANGTASIRIDYPGLSRIVSFSVSTSTTSGSTFYGFVTGSLSYIINSGVSSLVATGSGKSRSIFSTQDHANLNYVRNTNCWFSGINISCISPYNSQLATRKGATAITSGHIIMANHYKIDDGYTVRFVDMNNNVYDRVVASSVRIGSTDIQLGYLSSPLPSSIVPAKLMPSGFLRYFGVAASSVNPFGVPTYFFGNSYMLWTNQDNFVMASTNNAVSNFEAVGSLSRGTNVTRSIAISTALPTTNLASGNGLTGTVRSGDSGRPVFANVSGQLVHLFSMYNAGGGPDLAYYTSQIAALLQPGYSLQTISLGSLTQYSSGTLAGVN